MRVVFRADAAPAIGTGHVMRCLTLARALQSHDARVTFLSCPLPKTLESAVIEAGVALRTLDGGEHAARDWRRDAEQAGALLEGKADWLVVDHYGLDHSWETAMRSQAGRIMVIDDLADRPHDCDLILDQNLYGDLETRYDGKVPGRCLKLLGPRYALLRPQFYAARRGLRQRNGTVRRVLISFGGVDATNETGKAIEAVLSVEPDVLLDVVIPAAGPHRALLRQRYGTSERVTLHENVSDMAGLMVVADLAVGAAGTTTWERCYLGLPTVTLVIAPNQAQAAADLADTGATLDLGWHTQVTSADIRDSVAPLFGDSAKVRAMSEIAMKLMPEVPGLEPLAIEVMLGLFQ